METGDGLCPGFGRVSRAGPMDWKKPGSGSKYGLQLKIATPAAKKPLLNKSLPFSLDDSSTQDEYSVEDDIARQAKKKQFAREVCEI